MGANDSDSPYYNIELDAGAKLSFTAQIAGWSAKHRWWVMAASTAGLILLILGMAVVGTETRGDGEGVGESGKGSKLLDERFDSGPPLGEDFIPSRRVRIIFSNPDLLVSNDSFKATVEQVSKEVQNLPQVTSFVGFYDTEDPDLLAEDGHAVLALVTLQNLENPRSAIEVDPLLELVERAGQEAAGFEMGVVSFSLIEDQFEDILAEDFLRILIISLVIGLGILILAFRALVAAIIPLTLAVGSIFSALGVAALISQAYPLVDLYAEMVLLMGLAVGIDYSLFIVSRVRNERRAGRPRLEAISVASNTTGRAVFYAGVTVLLSLAGLTLTRDSTFISLALGAIIVVFIAIIASLTFLPALLAILGDKVERLKVPFLGKGDGQGGIWGIITDHVLARPAVLATISAAVLVALAIPVLFLNLGFNAGADSLPDAVEGKRAVELLEEHFSSSLIVPARVVVDAPDVRAPDVRAAVDDMLVELKENDSFLGPFDIIISQDGSLLRMNVPLAGKIDDDESENGVKLLRETIIPQAFANTSAEVYVTGDTADSLDFTDRMYSSAIYVFAFVLGLSFLLLLIMFRSIIIPFKALILNLLSVAAAYGVLVMVFQWGWGISILGSEETGIIESWLPLFLFGILFGLSMDYHMLLLNRIKERFDQTHDNEDAVSTGIRLTAGQITSAAAIMVGVFGAFASSRVLGLQQFGLGLAVAIFIDATIIRVVLLPASMKLLGNWNWYLPPWLDWLPKVTPEGSQLAPPSAEVGIANDD